MSTVFRVFACILLSFLVSTGASSAETAHAEINYDITVRINPAARTIEGRTVITATTSEELTLMLGRRFETVQARVDAAPVRSADAYADERAAAGLGVGSAAVTPACQRRRNPCDCGVSIGTMARTPGVLRGALGRVQPRLFPPGAAPGRRGGVGLGHGGA